MHDSPPFRTMSLDSYRRSFGMQGRPERVIQLRCRFRVHSTSQDAPQFVRRVHGHLAIPNGQPFHLLQAPSGSIPFPWSRIRKRNKESSYRISASIRFAGACGQAFHEFKPNPSNFITDCRRQRLPLPLFPVTLHRGDWWKANAIILSSRVTGERQSVLTNTRIVPTPRRR